jgi:2-desacetyl-2-hydroxyethyl bacteriochlorophyllide A dehydrogenase
MTGQALYFTGERTVTVREKSVPDPGAGEVLVRTERSAVSPGTELLVYRDEVPDAMLADETIDMLDGRLSYPLQYGYSTVGCVTAVDDSVDDDWLDRQVFAFNPHESHFLAEPEQLIPTTMTPQQALLLPNAEAAVNFVMDARPRIGARVVVFGQGPVGLLTTALLAEFPLSKLVTVDCYEKRRSLSRSFGADRAVSPDEVADVVDDPDVTFELSGNPRALDQAIDITGYAGQVIVGSWYGTKDVSLDLGGEYHRSHIRMQSSQVSRLDPAHADRWDKERRLHFVRSWLSETDLSALFTHELRIDDAPEAYQLLETSPSEAVQVTFTYN